MYVKIPDLLCAMVTLQRRAERAIAPSQKALQGWDAARPICCLHEPWGPMGTHGDHDPIDVWDQYTIRFIKDSPGLPSTTHPLAATPVKQYAAALLLAYFVGG